MSRDPSRPASTYRDRGREWDSRSRSDYRSRPDYDRDHNVSRKRSRSPNRLHRSGVMHSNESDDVLSKPKELWDNNQFQEADFGAPPPPSYQEGSNYGSNFQPPYSGLYNEFPTLSQMPPVAPPPPTDIMTWNQMSIPPAAVQPPQYNVEDQIKKEAAIESEMRQQKAALSKQREDYKRKVLVLKKELETLKDQRDELRGDPKRSPSPDTKRFLKENTKLQLEIQNKLKTIDNVVDMLNGIIGEDGKTETLGSDTEPIERTSKRRSRSPTVSTKFNYVYYDPEMHWCRVCNEFPSTAKDYLNHLHSATHTKLAAAHMEAPWHSVNGINEGYPSNPNAPNKRIPIKGLQFFVPSTAWYCKLCDQFIGDLHCASAHLKSVTHSKNYMNFVEQNPHWETDWVSDRQKSFEKNRPSKSKAEEKPQYTAHTITFSKDGFHTKSKHSLTPSPDNKRKKDKKKKNKKKRPSSSSSSCSTSTDSEKPKRKMVKVKKDNAKIEDLMSAIKMDRLNDSDRQLLHNIKNSLKHEDSKRRSNEEREREREREKEREMEKERERDRERERALRDRDRPREAPRKRERQLESTRRTPPQRLEVKPDFRKMPFIGKMPVYRNLSKAKSSEQRKEEERRREEEEEAERRKREEMDAEIQRKVAEFKQKIARGAERPQAELPPPALVHPTELGAPLVIHSQATQPQATPQPLPQQQAQQQPGAPSLPKDFQEALDIIFPSETKTEPQPAPADLFHVFPVGAVGAVGRVLPSYPPFLQPPIQPVFGFDVPHVYPSHHQLYDSQLPPAPTQPQQHQQPQQPRKPAKRDKKVPSQAAPAKADFGKGNGNVQKKQEELDEMALLGIDASDVGAM